MDEVAEFLARPEVRSYLLKMLEGNVLFGPRYQWDEYFQYEILDRGLVRRDGLEHKALLVLLEEAKGK